MSTQHVEGKNKTKFMLYALSTCAWCRKTKNLLHELDADYDFVYVDLLSADEKKKAVDEVEKWNPDSSFPTIVVDNKECIVGYKPEEIKRKMEK